MYAEPTQAIAEITIFIRQNDQTQFQASLPISKDRIHRPQDIADCLLVIVFFGIFFRTFFISSSIFFSRSFHIFARELIFRIIFKITNNFCSTQKRGEENERLAIPYCVYVEKVLILLDSHQLFVAFLQENRYILK